MKKGFSILLITLILPITTISQGWTPTKRLSWNTGDSEWPIIILGQTNDKFHLFWADESFGNFEIFQKTSTDKGNTWSQLRRLTWTSGDSRYPHAVSNSSGKIYITWMDETPGNKEIYFKKSTDDSVSWSGAKRITWTSDSSSYPYTLIDNNNHVYLFWQDRISPGNEEIFFKKSTDAGSTWGLTQRLTWTSRDSRGVYAAVDSSNTIHIVWFDLIDYEFQIFYKNGAMGGLSWSSPKRLTWTSESCMDPNIVIDSGNNIYIVWTYPSSYEELYFKKSTDAGTSWGVTKRLTWNAGRSIRQHLTIDSSGGLYMVWDDNSSGNYEIYFKYSNIGGNIWSQVFRLTWNIDTSISPKATMDSDDNIHIVWSDKTPGNFEILYKAYIFGHILNK